jgi:hypothetical protein
MKKIYLAAAALLSVAALNAQSQRMVLVEEFTQASCGPCAAANPAFNALLAPNLGTKVVAIKYQTNWPGVDPMNTQTQTWVGPRVSYYGVNGVPNGVVDGTIIPDDCSAYAGYPGCLTQSEIDARYNTPASFTLGLTHTMSADYDSIFITANITASQAFTSNGALKLHVALLEEEIIFATAPGTNGELDFYGVMRQMLPNASGTTLPSTWNNGDAQTVTFAVPVPSYIYDINKLQVAAFIQSDGNKEVQQAAITAPIPLANDAQPTAVTGLPTGVACSALTFSPSVTIKNNGSATLTSLDINVSVGGNPQPVYNWTGSLASGATTVVTLPAVSYSGASGNVPVVISTTNPNGTTDVNISADTKSATFLYYGGAAVAAPIIEGFASTTFPSGIMGVVNNDNDTYTWTRASVGGFQQGTGSAKLSFYNAASGTSDDLVLGNYNLSTVSNPNMTFSLAYRQYQAEQDRLQVMVSSDCGATWTTVYDKAGSTLSTVVPSQSNFTPTSASQWRTETVNLTAYATATNLLIKFVGTSAYGNNLYIDDINIGATAVEDNSLLSGSMNLVPNPANASVNLNYTLVQNDEVVINIYNSIGELVSTENKGVIAAGVNTTVVNTESLANGMYMVELVTGSAKSVSRLVVNH